MYPVVPGVKIRVLYHRESAIDSPTRGLEMCVIALYTPLAATVDSRFTKVRLSPVKGLGCQCVVRNKNGEILDPKKLVAELGVENGDELHVYPPCFLFKSILEALDFYLLFRHWWRGWIKRSYAWEGPQFRLHPVVHVPTVTVNWMVGNSISLEAQPFVLHTLLSYGPFEVRVTNNMPKPTTIVLKSSPSHYPSVTSSRLKINTLSPFKGIPLWCGALTIEIRCSVSIVTAYLKQAVDMSLWKKQHAVLHLPDGGDDTFCCTQIKDGAHKIRLVNLVDGPDTM